MATGNAWDGTRPLSLGLSMATISRITPLQTWDSQVAYVFCYFKPPWFGGLLPRWNLVHPGQHNCHLTLTVPSDCLPSCPPILQNPDNWVQPFSVSSAARVLDVIKLHQVDALGWNLEVQSVGQAVFLMLLPLLCSARSWRRYWRRTEGTSH